MKLGKSAAKSVSSVAPIIKTWEDEEAEWAALVTKAYSQVRTRPKPPPPRRREPTTTVNDGDKHQQQRRASLRQQQFRSIDASKQLDPSAAWRDDARASRTKQLKRVGVAVGSISVLLILVGIALTFDILGPLQSLFAALAAGDFEPDWAFDSLINFLLKPVDGLRHTR